MCMLPYYTGCKGPVCSKSHDCLRVPLFSSIQSSSAPFVSYSKRLVTKVCHWTWFEALREECTVSAAIRWIVSQIILVFSFINSALTTFHPLVSVIGRMNVWLCQILKKDARCCAVNKYVDSDLVFLFTGKSISETGWKWACIFWKGLEIFPFEWFSFFFIE